MNGSLIRRSGLIVAALSLALLFGAVLFLHSGSSASASDSETAKLISDINSYRTSHGIPALATSSKANADAQSEAEQAVAACGYTYGSDGHNAMLVSYGYETADTIFPAWRDDPYYGSVLSDPYYGSVGIGRAKSSSCTQWGYLWIAYFDSSGGGVTNPPTNTPSHTPTHTPSPTPTHTPSPTPTPTSPPSGSDTPTLTPTPTPTSLPSGSDTPTLTPTPTPTSLPSGSDTSTPSVSPTPTTPAAVPGDVDCGGSINMRDVILLLQAAADVLVSAPCLGPSGVDCTGGVDAADALVLLEFLENIPYHLPDGCPPLGSPTPSPTPEPTQTATPTPGVTPIPAGVNHCELAMVAYQLDTAESLNGEEPCTPAAGTAYDCVFSTDRSAACTASSSDFPDYTCSFGASFADCVPGAGEPEYQCFDDGAHTVECLPTLTGYAWYDCAVSGENVTCTSAPPFPDFACRHEGAEFSCLALPSPTPTAPPG